jgi:putative ABC transport system permease protein
VVKTSVLNKKLLRELMEIRFQVFSISLVVAIGVAVLFGFSSTHLSLKKSRDLFYERNEFPDLFFSSKKAPDAVAEEISKLPGVERFETRLEFEALLTLPKFDEPAVGHFVSLANDETKRMSRVHILRGRRPRHNAHQEIVISEGFFKAHGLRLGDEFSATLNARSYTLKIVGVGVSPEHVFALPPGSPMPDDLHYCVVWIPREALSTAYDMRSSFNSATVKLQSGANLRSALSRLDLRLKRYGGSGGYTRVDQTSYVYLREELKQLEIQAYTIPMVFYLVAAFILNIVMSRMVRSQRGEIATYKALGVSDLRISFYFFQMAAVIVLLGALLGIALGYWIGKSMMQLYGLYYHLPELTYTFSATSMLTAIFLALVASLAGVLSSLKGVFSLAPAEAMRPPAPANYRLGFWEKAFQVYEVSPKNKMVLRSLVSNPLKTLMVGLGLSFSVVIKITGLFWSDSLDNLLLNQYTFGQKQTGTISLAQDSPTSAVGEVLRLPGVLEAEGYRSAAIKVRFHTRTENAVIRGFPQDFKLTGLVDMEMREFELSPSDLVLSQILAKKLEVEIGDTLEIELREGHKPKLSLHVSRIYDGLSGAEILTSRKNLSRILLSQDRVDQILFRSLSDPSELYIALKNLPQVLSISFRKSALQFFEENSAKFLLVFAFILSAFAGAIGFGVAFNSMRVALAEKAWELSTLRILGFYEREAFATLAGEVLVLMLVFTPLGCLFGRYFAEWLLVNMSMESFRIPFVILPSTYLMAIVILNLSLALSSLMIYRLIQNLDIIATLKSRG